MPARSPPCSTSTWTSSGKMLTEKFAKKPRCSTRTTRRSSSATTTRQANFACPLPLPPREDGRDEATILIDGNTAPRTRLRVRRRHRGRLVSHHAGHRADGSVQVASARSSAWTRPRGKNNYAILQAEDELAAIGMVIGASWAGARSFTNTSGPGISLMHEFIGLAYYAEIPAVIFDVQRVRPGSPGMPTRTQQGDILLCAYASHGDTKHIVLFPANPASASTSRSGRSISPSASRRRSSWLTDLDIGMNDWMVKRFEWDDNYRPDRGKVLDAEDSGSCRSSRATSPVDGSASRRARCPAWAPRAPTSCAARARQASAAYTEDSDAVPGAGGPPQAQASRGGRVVPDAGHLSAVTAPRWGS
jgi:2-oxoglutarate ferredoxin oxidoreductase subunit alpha